MSDTLGLDELERAANSSYHLTFTSATILALIARVREAEARAERAEAVVAEITPIVRGMERTATDFAERTCTVSRGALAALAWVVLHEADSAALDAAQEVRE